MENRNYLTYRECSAVRWTEAYIRNFRLGHRAAVLAAAETVDALVERLDLDLSEAPSFRPSRSQQVDLRRRVHRHATRSHNMPSTAANAAASDAVRAMMNYYSK